MEPGIDIEKARQLRKAPTKAERLLWSKLRGQKLGFKFRRQHPFEGYVLDFYCPLARICIELDGLSHDGRWEYDERRTEALESHDILVLRYRNIDVLELLEEVVHAIYLACESRTETGEGES